VSIACARAKATDDTGCFFLASPSAGDIHAMVKQQQHLSLELVDGSRPAKHTTVVRN
jgi:hypothetical protein